jgi:hypothetical protein
MQHLAEIGTCMLLPIYNIISYMGIENPILYACTGMFINPLSLSDIVL